MLRRVREREKGEMSSILEGRGLREKEGGRGGRREELAISGMTRTETKKSEETRWDKSSFGSLKAASGFSFTVLNSF